MIEHGEGGHSGKVEEKDAKWKTCGYLPRGDGRLEYNLSVFSD